MAISGLRPTAVDYARYDERRKIFERFTNNPDDDHSLSSDGVTFIHEDSNGDLWIGTVSGLNKKAEGEEQV